jgi:putative heme iron utilization protein
MDDAAEILLSRLIRNARVAALGTIRAEGPNVSMVAFVAKEDFSAFFIHVSRLAQHTVDMRKDKHVSLLIAETDDGRTDPQTLARVSIRGSAEPMVVGEPGYNPIKKSYIDQFPTSAPLFELTDFSLWRIRARGGRFVAGFAKAYNITPETLQNASRR